MLRLDLPGGRLWEPRPLRMSSRVTLLMGLVRQLVRPCCWHLHRSGRFLQDHTSRRDRWYSSKKLNAIRIWLFLGGFIMGVYCFTSFSNFQRDQQIDNDKESTIADIFVGWKSMGEIAQYKDRHSFLSKCCVSAIRKSGSFNYFQFQFHSPISLCWLRFHQETLSLLDSPSFLRAGTGIFDQSKALSTGRHGKGF